MSGLRLAANCCAGSSWRCVVLAGADQRAHVVECRLACRLVLDGVYRAGAAPTAKVLTVRRTR